MTRGPACASNNALAAPCHSDYGPLAKSLQAWSCSRSKCRDTSVESVMLKLCITVSVAVDGMSCTTVSSQPYSLSLTLDEDQVFIQCDSKTHNVGCPICISSCNNNELLTTCLTPRERNASAGLTSSVGQCDRQASETHAQRCLLTSLPNMGDKRHVKLLGCSNVLSSGAPVFKLQAGTVMGSTLDQAAVPAQLSPSANRWRERYVPPSAASQRWRHRIIDECGSG